MPAQRRHTPQSWIRESPSGWRPASGWRRLGRPASGWRPPSGWRASDRVRLQDGVLLEDRVGPDAPPSGCSPSIASAFRIASASGSALDVPRRLLGPRRRPHRLPGPRRLPGQRSLEKGAADGASLEVHGVVSRPSYRTPPVRCHASDTYDDSGTFVHKSDKTSLRNPERAAPGEPGRPLGRHAGQIQRSVLSARLTSPCRNRAHPNLGDL